MTRFSRSVGCLAARLRGALWIASLIAAFLVTTGATYAQSITDSTPALYRLNNGSGNGVRCSDGCVCPLIPDVSAKGTFVLTPTGFDGLFTTFAVTEVNWFLSTGGLDTMVTGSGSYKIGGEFAVQQQLSLDLKVGDNPVEHFDSGLIAGPAPFPDINITISMHVQPCFDTVFTISASPVPPDEVRPYRLLSGSTFQRTCVGACDCAPGPLQPIFGRFALVPLESTPPWTEFAVIEVHWRVYTSSLITSSDFIPVRGMGRYRFGGDSTKQHELSLMLKVDGGDPARYDSGIVSGGDVFPRIDIRISILGATCHDTIIDLHGAPRRTPFRRSTRTDGDAL